MLRISTLFTFLLIFGYQSNAQVGEKSKSNQTTTQSPLRDSTVKTKTLETVAVQSRKPFVERKADKVIVNPEALISNAGTNVLEVLEKSPGILVDKDANISYKGKDGVVVLIDGRQTYMSGADLSEYLKGMSSSNVEAIELIANPSSKYDAAGRSGLINIRTKKIRLKGFNGNTNLAIAQGQYSRANGGVNLNMRRDKLNLAASVNGSYRKQFQDLTVHREYQNGGVTQSAFDQVTNMKPERSSATARVSADYFLNKRTTLGVSLAGSTYPRGGTNITEGVFTDGNNNPLSYMSAISNDHRKFHDRSVNINFTRSLDTTGTQLTADLDYLRYDKGQQQRFVTNNLDAQKQLINTETIDSRLPSDISIFSGKVDLTKPFGKKYRMEAGLKSSFVRTNNVAGYFNEQSGIFVTDAVKSNMFRYRENINAAYMSFSGDFKKLSLQAGLRAENTNYEGLQYGNVYQKDSAFDRSYTNFFPTAFASYKLAKKHELNASYSKRISRPNYGDLNPFMFFIDKYTNEAGNPFLRPMLSNSFELSYTYNRFLTVSANYTHSKDRITQYFRQVGTATTLTRENLGKADELSLSTTADFKATKWWNLTLSGEFNYNELNAPAQNLFTAGRGWNTQANNRFSFSKGWNAEVSAFYRSAQRQGQMYMSDFGGVQAGISKQVLKKAGTIKLNVNDIFYTNRQKGDILLPNTIGLFQQLNDSRFVTLGFSYRFGKPYKVQTRKAGGAATEQQRVGQ